MRAQSRLNGRFVAFTLVELMVSMGILSLLLLILLSITDATQRTWAHTSTSVEQFRSVREAMESVTRRLSHATLNTYLDYHYNSTGTPDRYIRQSELRFISGPASQLTGSSNTPSNAVFFQAPAGYVSDTAYSNLTTLLNTWGFFVEYGDDSRLRPDFINTLAGSMPLRHRFRLMELSEPSNELSLYQYTSGGLGANSKNSSYTGNEWFRLPFNLTGDSRPVRPVAENIVALVFLPMLSPSEQQAMNNASPAPTPPYTDASLAPDYLYDSTGLNMTRVGDANLNPKSQLPPIVQVTMIGVDEPSFERLNPTSTMPQLIDPTWFKSSANYAADLQEMEKSLADKKLVFRTFTTNVKIRGARWSRDQKN